MRRINIVPTEHGIKFIEDSEGDHVEYSDAQAEIAEKDKRIAELDDIAEGYRLTAELLNETLNKKIAKLEGEIEQWKLSRDGVMSTIERLTAENERLLDRAERAEHLHGELIMQVGKKHPGETRHETALRFIKITENGPCCCVGKEDSTLRKEAEG